MQFMPHRLKAKTLSLFSVLALLLCVSAGGVRAFADPGFVAEVDDVPAQVEVVAADEGQDLPFTVETLKLDNGSELVTIFYRMNGTFDRPDTNGERKPVPLISVLRDTLGDDVKENDKLRYVWMLTYT